MLSKNSFWSGCFLAKTGESDAKVEKSGGLEEKKSRRGTHRLKTGPVLLELAISSLSPFIENKIVRLSHVR